MSKLIQLPGSRPAESGEALVVQHLSRELPDTYTLIPNVEIVQRGRPAYEYDLIIVAPHAVYAVEVKNWRGGIRGDNNDWLVAGRFPRPNPWSTVNNKARVLKSVIEHRQPACADVWVEAIVIIADAQGELALQGLSRDRVFRYTDAPAFLTDPAILGGKAGDFRAVRAYLEKAIQEAAQGRAARTLTFSDYEVVETLVRRDDVADYIAVNKLLRGDERVRLRVFSYNPYLPRDEQALRQELMRREAEALQQMGAHPNLIGLRTFFTATDDPNLFIEVTDWSEEGTLRGLMQADAPLSLDRMLEMVQGIGAGLKAAHSAQVIHRDLRPENVLIGRDGRPKLMNFDHARIALPNARTISPVQRDPSVPQAYLAPELLDPARVATLASDIYSLGVILFEMLAGTPLYDSPEDALRQNTSSGGPAAFGVPDVPIRLNELVRRMTKPDPQARIQSADEVLAELQAVRERPSGTIIETPVAVSQPVAASEPAVFDIGTIIDGKYQVQSIFKAGGSGQVYKVYDSVWDQLFALKVFNSTNVSLDWLKQEAQTLKNLLHPNIVKVYTWGKLPSGRLYLVSEYVEGEELTEYTSGAKRMPVRTAVECIVQLLSALEALHVDVDRLSTLEPIVKEGEISEEEYNEWQQLKATGWLHRDIKPANLMRAPDSTLKLIDFNIAAKAHQADRTYTGTPGYMPPDIGLIPWDTSCDLFAVGVVLYELVTGHHPYPDRTPNMTDQPADPTQYEPNLSPQLVRLLLGAVSVDRTARYHSARRFRQDLLDLDGIYFITRAASYSPIPLTLIPNEVGRANYNPFVTRFLTMYSQARRDNSGTRGFDEVAQLTYVATRLDRLLKPAILDGQYRLVIITGNAGDGKTAFIKSVESAVQENGAAITQITPNSSRFWYGGFTYITNYDGSQDEGAERANDQVLSEFFSQYAANAVPPTDQVHIIAINEGRLIDFFGSEHGRQQFATLGNQILRYFERDPVGLPEWLLVIDLNERSIVAGDPEEPEGSIFERQLKAFLKPEYWAPCAQCELQNRCFIKFNADTLADPLSGHIVRNRLRTMFEIVHLRRKLHITMRDLRSALSWLIFRDQTCEDVAAVIDTDSGKTQLEQYYFNAYAADGWLPQGRRDDRLVALLRQIDPAETANPVLDREIFYQGLQGFAGHAFEQRSTIHEDNLTLASRELRTGWELGQDGHLLEKRQRYHAMLRRLAFFERRDDDWQAMLPYRSLQEFQNASRGRGGLEEIKSTLIQGLSMAEGARNEKIARSYICVRAGQEQKVRIKSFRLFPEEQFRVEVPSLRSADGRYLEYTPDHLVFYHAPDDPSQRQPGAQRAELRVSLDVLELLTQVCAGFVPSLNDIHGEYINLVIFKNALAHLPYRRVLLTRDDHTFYELILREPADVVLQLVYEEKIAA